MPNIKITYSLSGYGSEKLETLASMADQKSLLVKFPLRLACACTQTLFIVAALVETVACHALALVIKALTFLIPAGLLKTLDTKIISPLFTHAKISFEAFFKSLIRSLSRDPSGIAFDKFYCSRFIKKIIHIHITGDSRSKEKIESPYQLTPLPPAPIPSIQPKEETKLPIKESVTGLLGLSTLAACYKFFSRKVQLAVSPIKSVPPPLLLSDFPHNPPPPEFSLFKNTFFPLPVSKPLQKVREFNILNDSIFDKPIVPAYIPRPIAPTPQSFTDLLKPSFPVIDNRTCPLRSNLFTTPPKIPQGVEHNLTKPLPDINKTWIFAGISALIAVPVIYYLGKKIFGSKAAQSSFSPGSNWEGNNDYSSPFQPMQSLVRNHTPRRLRANQTKIEEDCIKIEKTIIQLILKKQEEMLGTNSNLREIDHNLLYILLTDTDKTARFKEALQALCQMTLADFANEINGNEVERFKQKHKSKLSQLERDLRKGFREFDKELSEFDHLKQILNASKNSKTPETRMFLTPTKNGQRLTPKTGFIKRHRKIPTGNGTPLQGKSFKKKLDFSATSPTK